MEDNIERNVFFDFKKQPGKYKTENLKINNPLISVITSYYNYKDYIMQTYYSLNNQTFPYWEWIIVNDGSTESGTEELLDFLKSQDNRIKVFNKVNEGLAKGRDYGISKSSTDLIFPLDADDLIEPTTLECCYWALKTNPNATWAYTNIVNFGEFNDLDKRTFNDEQMKIDNMITATALIRKSKILEVGGYSIAKRYINEDWHLWLRMMQRGYYPVELGFYGFWYRRKKKSLLTFINSNENSDNEKRKKELAQEAEKIDKKIEAKIYLSNYNEDESTVNNNSAKVEYSEINKITSTDSYVLYVTNYLNTDQTKFNLLKEQVKKNNKKAIILTTEPSSYIYRQKYEEIGFVYDLTTFLDKKCWNSFIEYLICTRNICDKFIVNCKYEQDFLSALGYDCNVYNYVENNDLYFKDVEKYKKSRRLFNRIIRKICKKFRNIEND